MNLKRTIVGILVASLLSIWVTEVVSQTSKKERESARLCIELLPSGAEFTGAGDKGFFWKKRELRVNFVNGTPFQINGVKAYVDEWTRYANIRFVFVDSGPSDIRVAFKYRGNTGSHSWVGTGAASRPRDEPTMNFGWFEESQSEDELRAVALHEFGHALGMMHEHQAPTSGMDWKREVVLAEVAELTGWSPEKIEHNILRRYDAKQSRYTEYDPLSIMHYPFPPHWTRNAVTGSKNTQLSERDKLFIASVYPRVDLTVSKASAAPIDYSKPLTVRAGEKLKLEFEAPFKGYAYLLSAGIDGTSGLNPSIFQKAKLYREGSKVRLEHKVTKAGAQDLILLFSPTKLRPSGSSAPSSAEASSMIGVAGPPPSLPSTDGLGAVSTLLCSTVEQWLGSSLGFRCVEGSNNVGSQPVVVRVSMAASSSR